MSNTNANNEKTHVNKVKNGISKKSFVKNVAKQVNMPKDFFD